MDRPARCAHDLNQWLRGCRKPTCFIWPMSAIRATPPPPSIQAAWPTRAEWERDPEEQVPPTDWPGSFAVEIATKQTRGPIPPVRQAPSLAADFADALVA